VIPLGALTEDSPQGTIRFGQALSTMHMCFHSSKTNFSSLISSSDRQVPTLPKRRRHYFTKPSGMEDLR
jgi:hypothetical protein